MLCTEQGDCASRPCRTGEQINTSKFGKMQTGSKILNSEGKTGASQQCKQSSILWRCDSGRGGEKLLGEKQLDRINENWSR